MLNADTLDYHLDEKCLAEYYMLNVTVNYHSIIVNSYM